MRIFLFALAGAVAFIHASVAPSHARLSPEATALAAFVAKPGVVLDLVEEVGGIRSLDATVRVAAVIASDSGHPGEQMEDLRSRWKTTRTPTRCTWTPPSWRC
ncbi:MAG: hypothetical protein WD793_05330 [Steroidobacteraceae bacterium]